MSYIGKFRELLGMNLRGTDRQMSAVSESARDVLNARAAMHVATVYREAESDLDRMIAEHNEQFDQVEPLTLEGTFEELPAQAQLAAPTKPANDEPQPEAPAASPPVVASEPPVEAVDEPKGPATLDLESIMVSPLVGSAPDDPVKRSTGRKRNRSPRAG